MSPHGSEYEPVQYRDWLSDSAAAAGSAEATSAFTSLPTVDQMLEHGNSLAARGLRSQAAEVYQALLSVHPTHIYALNNLGVMAADSGAPEEASRLYKQALMVEPDFVDALYNLGNAYRELRRYRDAVNCYEKVLQLQPEFAPAITNRAVSQLSVGDADLAIDGFHRSLELDSQSAETWTGLGLALSHVARYDEAYGATRRALELDPRMAEAHYNLSLLELLHGRYASGWEEYEWRFRLERESLHMPGGERWDGRPLNGRRILLVSEQGLGDTIQFVRFAQLLKNQGAKVLLLCSASHSALFSRVPGIDECVPRESGRVPQFDYCLPLMSLGKFLAPSAEHIPGSVPYIQPSSEAVDEFRSQFDKRFGTDELRVGIAWRGSPGYRWDCHRSIPLNAFSGLARIPGVRLFSFQKGAGQEELRQCDWDIEDLGEGLDNGGQSMVGSLAAASAMDLLVTADTSLGHLGGASGVPTWIVLPLCPDWRWRTSGDRSAWYPSVRLFRQAVWKDWGSAFQQVESAVHRLFSEKTGRTARGSAG